MKKLMIAAAVAFAAATAPAAIAQEVYANVGVSGLDGDGATLTAATLRGGAFITEHFGAEAEFSVGLGGESIQGVALDLDERERLVRDLGPEKSTMLLRNHGTLTCGSTAAMAFTRMFFLERACSMQVQALSAGRDGVLECGRDIQEKVAGQGSNGMEKLTERLVWPGLKRKLDREAPGYDA